MSKTWRKGLTRKEKKERKKKITKIIKITLKMVWLFKIGWDGSGKNRQFAIIWMALRNKTSAIAMKHYESKSRNNSRPTYFCKVI